MDPATATSLAITVHQILTAVFSYGQDVFHAKKDIRQLAAEIVMLKAILEQVRTVSQVTREVSEKSGDSDSTFTTSNIATPEWNEMIATTEKMLSELIGLLHLDKPYSKTSTIIRETWQKVKWHLDKVQAQEYINRVERAKN
ncbi:hypothetical protein MMC25_002276 [Agyrium rufum]|nr:hypothetical protein [Agyrium rufum]